MISQLTKIIRKHPEWLRCAGAPLSFMKVSMPTSGGEMDKGKGKVLLFVFEQGQITPTICAKTTRVYSAGDVIRRNHGNLKLLEAGVRGSELAMMFALPLYLYDDGEVIFCVESVCPGVMFSAQTRGLELMVEKYIVWQSHLARTADKFLGTEDIQNLARGKINALKLPEAAVRVLRNYLQKFPLSADTKLPVIVQYGDMSPDNVLIFGNNVYFIDYDYVGASMLPGFDLFNFLSKSRGRVESFHAICERYFPPYFRSIGAKIESYDIILFIYYLEELYRKGYIAGEKSGEEIVTSFLAIMNRK